MAWLKNNYQFEFMDTLTTSWTSVRISNEKENGAVAVFTNQYITVRSEDNSIVERMKGSASAWVLTLTMRWLDQSDTDTQNAWLKKERREWAKAFVTYVASQHVDPRDNNTFDGTQTFTNIVVSQDVTVWDDLTVAWDTTLNGRYKWPRVANTTARDALYPSPTWAEEVYVDILNAKQIYNPGTAQRDTQDVGTPAPDATEFVKGIAKISSDAQVTAWTDDATIITPKKLRSQLPEALVDKDTYILWEDCNVNESLFPETKPTFSESTVVQNIWDTAANTRVVLTDFWSWVSWSTMKLSLRKFVSPSVDLSVRLETLNVNWNPTWTLVNANAVSTVSAASLTTSLVDTTVTFAWSFTIPLWQKYWIVLNAVGDVVNWTNYFGIGYASKDTRTRILKLYNWSSRYTDRPDWVDSIQSFWFVLSGSATSWAKLWVKIVPTRDIYLTQVTKTSTLADTIAYVTDSSLTTISQSNFSWNIATFPQQLLLSWVVYYILTDQWWLSRSFRSDDTTSFPLLLSWLNLVAWRSSSGDSLSFLYNIESITIQNKLDAYNLFPYVSSVLSIPVLLSKTSGNYTYKLPTDFPRIANEAKSAGSNVVTTFIWLKWWFSWLSPTTYYIWNTPWSISTTPWTNPYVVWQWIDSTTLKIEWKNLNKSITVTASPFSYTNNTGWPIQVKITWWTVNPIVINWVTVATATGHINTLPAGATMVVTYSSTPTIVYSDL